MFNNLFSFINSIKNRLFFSIASFFKADEHQELLKKVNTHLMLWDKRLINLTSGDSVQLASDSPEDLALAAYELLQKIRKKSRIALYLHPSEFVATEYQLPNVASQNIIAALKYQVDNLLPAYPRTLLLAAHHNESRESNIALWFDQPRSEQLYNSFTKQGLDLISIVPRSILMLLNPVLEKNIPQQFVESDQQGMLSIMVENQTLTQWHYILQDEMQEEDYFLQWQNEIAEIDEQHRFTIENDSYYQDRDFSYVNQLYYAFFPDTVRQQLQQRSRLKKGRLAMLSTIILISLLAIPFVKNHLDYEQYKQQYEEYNDETIDIRKMRASVNQFKDDWALFIEYPAVDNSVIISKLNTIIPKNSWISLFEIKDNRVEIEGKSPNAAGILEVISQQPEFDQVAFNQRTRSQRDSNEHFGISFRLKNNIEEYQEKFFSE